MVEQQLLGTGEAFFGHQGGHGDLNPLFARALVAGGIAGRSYTPPKLRGNHLTAMISLRRLGGLYGCQSAAHTNPDARH